MSEASKAFWIKCPTCNHCWPGAYYPMEAGLFAKIALGHCRCQKCGEKKTVVAKQDNGTLLEQVSPDQPGKSES